MGAERPSGSSSERSSLCSGAFACAVEYLAEQPPDGTVTISDLSEHVAARENNCTVTELSSTQRERVYVSLYQTHLITMDSVIDYDRGRGTITPTEAPARLWSVYQDFCSQLDG
jgi:hypothetical protein